MREPTMPSRKLRRLLLGRVGNRLDNGAGRQPVAPYLLVAVWALSPAAPPLSARESGRMK